MLSGIKKVAACDVLVALFVLARIASRIDNHLDRRNVVVLINLDRARQDGERCRDVEEPHLGDGDSHRGRSGIELPASCWENGFLCFTHC